MGVLRHAEFPGGINDCKKKNEFKNLSFLAKMPVLIPYKNSLSGLFANIDRKVVNRVSGFENLLLDKFWIPQGTRDKEIAKRRKARVRAKNPIDNYSFSVHCFYI